MFGVLATGPAHRLVGVCWWLGGISPQTYRFGSGVLFRSWEELDVRQFICSHIIVISVVYKRRHFGVAAICVLLKLLRSARQRAYHLGRREIIVGVCRSGPVL